MMRWWWPTGPGSGGTFQMDASWNLLQNYQVPSNARPGVWSRHWWLSVRVRMLQGGHCHWSSWQQNRWGRSHKPGWGRSERQWGKCQWAEWIRQWYDERRLRGRFRRSCHTTSPSSCATCHTTTTTTSTPCAVCTPTTSAGSKKTRSASTRPGEIGHQQLPILDVHLQIACPQLDLVKGRGELHRNTCSSSLSLAWQELFRHRRNKTWPFR